MQVPIRNQRQTSRIISLFLESAILISVVVIDNQLSNRHHVATFTYFQTDLLDFSGVDFNRGISNLCGSVNLSSLTASGGGVGAGDADDDDTSPGGGVLEGVAGLQTHKHKQTNLKHMQLLPTTKHAVFFFVYPGVYLWIRLSCQTQ